MITLMEDLPDNVIGMIADKMVTGEDYETIVIPAVDKALENHGKVRAIYVTAPGFEGYGPAAMWDDTKIGFAHLTAWEKIAVVTDVEWLRMMITAFGFMMMGHLKLFKADELDAAKAWILE